MDHSSMYNSFIKIINSSGIDRLGGVPRYLLDEIYDWERDEVEEIIWNRFVNLNEMDLAFYLPRLKNYRPLEEVKKKLEIYPIPSEISVILAYTLYKLSGDTNYLEIVRENINKKEKGSCYTSFVLQDCELDDKNIYNLLKTLYSEITNPGEIRMVEDGLFYYKGILKQLFSVEEDKKNLDLIKKYYNSDVDERKKLINEFEKEFP